MSDREYFHVFDEPDERCRFAEQAARALVTGGLWLSLIGSTEGPPRRSASEVTLAIEPAVEVVELRSAEFRGHNAKAWFMSVPAARCAGAALHAGRLKLAANVLPVLDGCPLAVEKCNESGEPVQPAPVTDPAGGDGRDALAVHSLQSPSTRSPT
jgi:hypothetical protein